MAELNEEISPVPEPAGNEVRSGEQVRDDTPHAECHHISPLADSLPAPHEILRELAAEYIGTMAAEPKDDSRIKALHAVIECRIPVDQLHHMAAQFAHISLRLQFNNQREIQKRTAPVRPGISSPGQCPV